MSILDAPSVYMGDTSGLLTCIACWQALGAFHVAVELCDWEWSFGWNEDGTTGVFSGLPTKCDMHTYPP
eukprot:COSAG05_NODE_4257_length_1595_cov_4.658422_3_plen_69_part_00